MEQQVNQIAPIDAPPTENVFHEKSASITKLASALAKAQGEIENAEKDSLNPHFKSKYADLASVRAAYRDPLKKHGLSLMQIPSANGAKVKVKTILMHESGEYISGELEMTAQQNTPQAIGSAATYCRRYSASAFTGVAPDDDDGNEATGKPAAQQQSHPQRSAPQAAKPAARSTAASNGQPKNIDRKGAMVMAYKKYGVSVEMLEQFTKTKFERMTDATVDEMKRIFDRIEAGEKISDFFPALVNTVASADALNAELNS